MANQVLSSCNEMDFDCDCDCRNQLDLDKLCCKKIKAHKIRVKELCAEEIGSDKICANSVISKDMSTDTLCANKLQLNGEFCAQSLSSPMLCAQQVSATQADLNSACIAKMGADNACIQNLIALNAEVTNLTANQLCVPGPLSVANLLNCGKYRASATYSMLTSYSLGADIDFDVILDDPNGNMLAGPSRYTAPVSGYYSVMLNINEQNLIPSSGFGPVLGVPAANTQLYVNGILYRETYTSFLAFFAQQKAVLSGILLLNAGDVVTMRYNILALNSASGLVSIPGTIDSQGDGTSANSSIFQIHMLSVNCPDLPCAPSGQCSPCSPMQCVPCQPSTMPCATCIPCEPCKPCMPGSSNC